jgi:DNA-binding CsgD family transcriptional regulator/PAS domain-containing protein
MLQSSEPPSEGNSSLLSLIELVYSAVSDSSLWPLVLERISDAIHGEQTLFFSPLQESGQPPALCSSRTAPEVLPLYLEHYHSVNPLTEPCDNMFRDGMVRYSHWAVPDSEYEHSEFFNDFMAPLKMHYSCGLKIPLDCGSPAYLASQRAKEQGPFEEHECGVLQTVMPHLQRALTLHVQFTQMRSTALGLERALDVFNHAVFGLDRKGQLIFANSQAEAILSAGVGLSARNRRLSASILHEDHRLQRLLVDAAATGSGSGAFPGGSMLVARKSGKSALRVTVTPFSSSLPGRSLQLAALVFVSDPAQNTQPRGATLRALFGLTPSEMRVADLLLQGLEVREVAERLGLTLETGRFHVKRILSKAGVRRQTDFMRLMLSLPGLN